MVIIVVLPMFHQQYQSIYSDIKNENRFSTKTSLNKSNDASCMNVDNFYAHVPLHYNLQMQHPRVFPLISVTLAGR